MKTNILFLIFITTFFLPGCSWLSGSDACSAEESGKMTGRLFALGENAAKSEILGELILKSGLNSEGYALIITGNDTTGKSYDKKLEKALNYYKILAVHTFPVEENMLTSHADMIKIESAKHIFLTFDNRKHVRDFLNTRELKNAVVQAFENGASVTAIDAGVDVLGEISVVSTTDTLTGKNELVFNHGLGLATGYWLDKEKFFGNNETLTLETVNREKVTFAGIGPGSALEFCNGNIVVIKPDDLIIKEPK